MVMLVTGNIGLNLNDNTAWSSRPGDRTLEEVGGGTATTPTLGTAVAATGQTLAAGYWLLVPDTDTASIVHSTGTTVAGSVGHVYSLTMT